MKTIFRSSFLKDLKAVRDRELLKRLGQVIVQVESAQSLAPVPNLKQLKGDKNHYRIRIGEYRLGVILHDDTVTFVRFLHRKDIYRYFP